MKRSLVGHRHIAPMVPIISLPRYCVSSDIRLCHLGPVILSVMGWVCYYQEEFEFGHSTYVVKESVDYHEGWKTENDDKCYVDWASDTYKQSYLLHFLL